MSRFSQYMIHPNDPQWQTQQKKIIPSHLTKRKPEIKFTENDDFSSSPSSPFTSQRSFGVNFGNTKQGSEVPIVNGADDLPPQKSLFDVYENEDNSSSFPKDTDLIKEDPTRFRNIFSKNTEKKEEISPVKNGDSAVLVFGFVELDEVLVHFEKFGSILEDFRNSGFKKKYPIFIGKQWVKITYDNPASAVRALRENGTILDGAVVGVIPYTKQSLEQLLNSKISEEEDIGDTFHSDLGIGNLNLDTKQETGYKIRDGKDLFKNKPSKPQVGFFAQMQNYLFGASDI
ncbi:unnamed protein product [Kuraishia capsulata CBS 1993]|uniref:RRM Nup35-type domain-containing protein n=1 Tax=Kuraishia capsulata CBS 1993 TaxID=1382522 RepID=W6MJM3_9ASCO|nr:uncharacterized protein KUCA_T00002149001 [Kuraishia capsulata CBS 1993]CDK26178.1 unnamed protein product [Kuraishia capsulata CBS 1993]